MNCIGLAATLSLVLSAGCDGDGDGVTIPVDGSKKVSELNQDEAKKVCEAGQQVFQNLQVPTCTILGLGAKAAGKDCEQAKQDCLENFSNDDDDSCTDVGTDDVSAECDVTVSQIESCFNGMAKALDAALPDVSCSTSTEELQELQKKPLPKIDEIVPEACKSISEACDELDLGFDTGDSSDA